MGINEVNKTVGAGLLTVFCLGFVPPLLAESTTQDLAQRIDKLERIMDNRQVLQLLQRLDETQQALQQMKGELEVSQRQIEVLQTRQRDLYKDIDDRLSRLARDQADIAHSQPTTEGEQATDLATTAKKLDDAASYQAAYQLLSEKQYSQAQAAFEGYLAEFTNGDYLPNAYYWLGEIYLLDDQPGQAKTAFRAVIADFPTHQKAGDALLKLGYAYAAGGNQQQARETFLQVKAQYQGSTLARLADDRLAQIAAN